MAAIEYHKTTSYNAEFVAKAKADENLVGPPEMRVLTPTGGFMRKPPQ
jgi:hypothetical protein